MPAFFITLELPSKSVRVSQSAFKWVVMNSHALSLIHQIELLFTPATSYTNGIKISHPVDGETTNFELKKTLTTKSGELLQSANSYLQHSKIESFDIFTSEDIDTIQSDEFRRDIEFDEYDHLVFLCLELQKQVKLQINPIIEP